VPAALKAQFDAVHKDFDAVRVKFGVSAAIAAGRGGGGGRGGDPENVLARATTLKLGVMGMWEAPSAATVKQSAEVKLAVQQAVTEANAMLAKATTISQSLSKYDIVLTVPATIK
jgi:NAD(P)H-dependent FMN reductase